MAAAGSGPHLDSPTPAVRDALQASAPGAPVPCGGTPGLPPSPDGCTFVPAAQAIPLQVDMAMALQRVRISEKYGQSYLCLLQAVFVAGKFPPRARRPAASAPARLARASAHWSLASPAGRRAHFVCARTPHPLPHCRGAPGRERPLFLGPAAALRAGGGAGRTPPLPGWGPPSPSPHALPWGTGQVGPEGFFPVRSPPT